MFFAVSSIPSRQIEKRTRSDKETGQEKDIFHPFGIHEFGSKKEAKLDFFNEAGGIRSAFSLIPTIYKALDSGGLAIIDELEANLHPLMIEPLINLFI